MLYAGTPGQGFGFRHRSGPACGVVRLALGVLLQACSFHKNSWSMEGQSKSSTDFCNWRWPSSQASAVTPSGVSMQVTPSCETS